MTRKWSRLSRALGLSESQLAVTLPSPRQDLLVGREGCGSGGQLKMHFHTTYKGKLRKCFKLGSEDWILSSNF